MPRVIISLTSFPARIPTLHMVIQSLLQQKKPADLVVLYLTAEQFPDRKLSPELEILLKNDKFNVRFVPENIKSFTKLIYALQEFPNDIIITVDDDYRYPNNLTKMLLRTYKKHPDCICSNIIRKIGIENGHVLPYNQWRRSMTRRFYTRINASYTNLLMGFGGVLYPPHTLSPEVQKSDIFKQICPHQDDIWFWAMAVLNSTKIIPTRFGIKMGDSCINETQSVGLYNTINSSETSPNNIALTNIMNKYPEIKEKIGL